VTRRIVAQPALAPFQPEEFRPGPQYQSDDELARLAGDIASTIFHPVGTTRMGRDDDPMAVVDSRLRVRGVDGLRVVDAGVMPTITSGNTNSPTLMIAEKAARWIMAGRRRGGCASPGSWRVAGFQFVRPGRQLRGCAVRSIDPAEAGNFRGILFVDCHPFGVRHPTGLSTQQDMQMRRNGKTFRR
jgi:hypothetical protein